MSIKITNSSQVIQITNDATGGLVKALNKTATSISLQGDVITINNGVDSAEVNYKDVVLPKLSSSQVLFKTLENYL